MKKTLFLSIAWTTLFLFMGSAVSVYGETSNFNKKSTFTVTYQIANYPYAGSIQAYVNGEYLPSGGTVNAGANVDFFVTSWGYVVQDWVINGNSSGVNTSNYTYQDVQSDLSVNVFLMEYIHPQITPNEAMYALSDPQDLVFTVDYGSESSIEFVIREVWETNTNDTLDLGTDYTISGNQLVINSSYLQSLNPQIFDYYQFRVVFGSGVVVNLGIQVVGTTVPIFDPDQLTYDLSNPGSLFTLIVYADANELVSLTYNNTPLIPGDDYSIQRTILIINQNFLAQHLQSVGQSITLVGVFNNQETASIQINAVQSGVYNATIDPTSSIFNSSQIPDYVDITITWNSASSITQLLVRGAFEYGIMEFPWFNYEVTNLGGGQARLRIFFDDKAESFLKQKANIYYGDYQVLIFFDQGAPASYFLTIFTITYDVNVTVIPNEGGFVYGAWEYEEGDNVNLQAVANWGYVFSRWENETGTVLGTDPDLSFTMPASDVNLTAYFVQAYQITYWALDGSGTIEAFYNGEVISSGNFVPSGSRIVFRANPNTGYKVNTWFLNGDDLLYDGLEYVVESVSQNMVMMVSFVEIPANHYMVTYNVVGGNGQLSAIYGQAVINSGGVVPSDASVTFIAQPNNGYEVKEWTVNGEVVSNFVETELTVSNITGAMHVTVEFEEIVSIETKPLLSFSLYPNPVESVASLASSFEMNRVSLLNMMGQTVLLVEKPGSHLNLVGLSPGIYLIVAETLNGDIVTQKIVKK